MEKNLSLFNMLKEEFNCREVDLRTYSPLTLAYIGDSIFDVVIRTIVVSSGNKPAHELHRSVVQYVNAGTQAAIADALQEELTADEETIYKRGRNAKSATMAKNASVIEYRKATGLEALIGYLYLHDELKRAVSLIKTGLEKLNL